MFCRIDAIFQIFSGHKENPKAWSKLNIFFPRNVKELSYSYSQEKQFHPPTKTSFNLENVSLDVMEWTRGLISSLAGLH